MASCLIVDPFVEWDDVVNWSIAAFKGKGLQVSLCKLCFAACVYLIWKQMNDLWHGNTPRRQGSRKLFVQIKWEVRARIMVKCAVKKSACNDKLMNSWNIRSLM